MMWSFAESTVATDAAAEAERASGWASVWETVKTWCLNTGVKILVAILVLVVSFILINVLTARLKKRLEKSKKADKTLSRTLVYVSKIVLKILVVVALVGYLGIDTSGISALIASLGVAIGLAVNGTLSNLAGGVMILVTRPFRDDDYISALGYEGTVEAIRITHTKLRTFDNKVAYLPNGTLSTSSILNYSEKDTRRVDNKFSVSYDSDCERVRTVLKDLCDGFEPILKTPAPAVGIASYDASSITFYVRTWCKNADYWTVYNYLMDSAKKAFDENGISIPYDQLDVHVIAPSAASTDDFERKKEKTVREKE